MHFVIVGGQTMGRERGDVQNLIYQFWKTSKQKPCLMLNTRKISKPIIKLERIVLT
jgi:hypothetical protein